MDSSPETPVAQLSISTRTSAASVPSTLWHAGHNVVLGEDMQKGNHSQHAEHIVNYRKKLQDDLLALDQKVKHYEDNIKYLREQDNRLEESILDTQVALGKYHTKNLATENEDHFLVKSEEETIKNILRHEKSAAAVLYRLKTLHGAQVSNLEPTKDVLGIVATLGKVDDDNLSRLLSDYLGLENMLAVVCKTLEGVKALEAYDKGGSINKSLGLHGLGSSLGKPVDGPFLVFCLKSLSPYVGKFVENDPQRRLDLLKPRLPNGELPSGFLGFAVNLIKIDSIHLHCISTSGSGLRETLFYNLFSNLQVYKSREDMLKALPCISNGAISLDGGMIRKPGVFSLGNGGIVDVKFPKSSEMVLSENYFETEKQMKETKWKKERMLEDMLRDQAMLDHAKYKYKKKKREFVQLGHSLSYTSQTASRTTSQFGLPVGNGKMVAPHDRLSAQWDEATKKVFFRSCLEEVIAGNRPDGHLNGTGWKNVAAKFRARTGRDYNMMQLKNFWNASRKDYYTVKELMENEICLGYNPKTRETKTSSEWWDKVKNNPKFKKFRRRNMSLLLEYGEALFGDVYTKGENVRTPWQFSNLSLEDTAMKVAEGYRDMSTDKRKETGSSYGQATVEISTNEGALWEATAK